MVYHNMAIQCKALKRDEEMKKNLMKAYALDPSNPFVLIELTIFRSQW
jgi:hypothetical protein